MMKTKKRDNYLDWDDTFMLLTELIAQRSKDPNSQIGACIVNNKNIIVGVGYNGFPRGCSDDELPWNREGKLQDTKYGYIVHAEANAIINSNASVEGCRIYTNLFPCNECAQLIIQSGIKEVIYYSNKYKGTDVITASERLFKLAKIKVRQYSPKFEMKLEKVK